MYNSAKGKGRAIVTPVELVDTAALLDGVDFEDDEEYEAELESRQTGRGDRRMIVEDSDDEMLIVHAPKHKALPPVKAPIVRAPPPRQQHVAAVPAEQLQQRQQQLQAKSGSVPKAPVPAPVPRIVAAAAAAGGDPARLSSAPKMNHPWSRDVSKALRQRFNLTGFRPHQEEAINATLSGRDVFVLLPTGGGKSLCFQLPAVVSSGKTKGVTIVISPLLSLIADQTKSLKDKDIPVVFLNSTMPAADRAFAMSSMRSNPPTTCLAYVTPEQVSLLPSSIAEYRY